MSRKNRTSFLGCLIMLILLPIKLFIKPLMSWDGFTTSSTKRRKRK